MRTVDVAFGFCLILLLTMIQLLLSKNTDISLLIYRRLRGTIYVQIFQVFQKNQSKVLKLLSKLPKVISYTIIGLGLKVAFYPIFIKTIVLVV